MRSSCLDPLKAQVDRDPFVLWLFRLETATVTSQEHESSRSYMFQLPIFCPIKAYPSSSLPDLGLEWFDGISVSSDEISFKR